MFNFLDLLDIIVFGRLQQRQSQRQSLTKPIIFTTMIGFVTWPPY